ncbi:hypothetical protein J7M22_07520 [Candidatus Poribacteria bacterium]|nr:hypothetical protein [Candidatus Poribacteria bacterium]
MGAVIPPWTPVEAEAVGEEVRIEIWGRTYLFEGSPFPTSIITAEREILSSPIRLVGTVDGKPIAWKGTGSALLRRDDDVAVVSGWGESGSLILNVTSHVEFDGMMRVDMVVTNHRTASPTLEGLYLEIPLRADRSKLFHYWPGRWGSAENSGAVPQDGLKLPFKPFIWLGWEEGGLSWFAESDKGWRVSDPNCAVEVISQGEGRILRLHLLDSPLNAFPLTITFGLQATPVKPIPRDFHEWRICHGAYYGMVEDGTLDRMAEMGVRTLVFHESWTPVQNYWITDRETELKRLASECHKRGIKLLLYFGYELSTLAPEWGELSDDVLVKNPQGRLAGGYQRRPPQRDYIVCYKSEWAERLVEGIAKALDRYGFDGVYLDGTIEPWGCANERHGCGYRTPEGSLRATYPIFAVRSMMRRLYELIHPRGGLVNAHQSTCCLTPTLSFCHSYWDGEQFGGGELSGDPLRKLPLETFRAEFMGVNFGVPSEFLVYERPPNWTFEHALAFTLLHNVLVRPSVRGEKLRLISKIWTAFSDFGVGEAQWHPYWRNDDLIDVKPQQVKASLYLKGSRALLVISNLSAQEEVTGEIELKFPLRLKAAFDAVTGEVIELEGNRLALPLAPMRARLIRVE